MTPPGAFFESDAVPFPNLLTNLSPARAADWIESPRALTLAADKNPLMRTFSGFALYLLLPLVMLALVWKAAAFLRDGMITQVRLGCGPFRTRVNGVKHHPPRRMVRGSYRRGY
jgi:hypothetical protein